MLITMIYADKIYLCKSYFFCDNQCQKKANSTIRSYKFGHESRDASKAGVV
jgi:hypothetical protein